MKISYYELLGMIREGVELKDLKVYLTGNEYKVYTYCSDSVTDDFSHYEIKNKSDIDENYRDYLADCFLESMMFDKCIEFVEEDKEIEFEDIEEIDLQEKYLNYQPEIDELKIKINILIKNQKKLIDIINNLKGSDD